VARAKRRDGGEGKQDLPQFEERRKMKLICFHLYNDYSGSPKVLKNLLARILERGVEVELITSAGGVLDELPQCDNLKRRYYRYKFSNCSIVTMLRYTLVQVYTFFVALGYMFDKEAVFYINTILPVAPALAGRLIGKKVIYHYHENATVKSTFYRVLAWVMQKAASKIICVSNYQRSFLKREKGITVIPNAVEEKFVKGLTPNPEKAFKEKRILMIGSLKVYKGTLEFIGLAQALQQCKFELVLNDTQENIDAFLHENNIVAPGNLAIYPRQNDVSKFYNHATLVLNLTNRNLAIETFGLTALEAMCAGLPVIVPTVGGIAEMVEDGVNGYRIDVQNMSEIKEKIENIISNRELYLSLSKGALELSGRYDAGTMSRNILHEIETA